MYVLTVLINHYINANVRLIASLFYEFHGHLLLISFECYGTVEQIVKERGGAINKMIQID